MSNSINLTITPGQLTAIVGPVGAGKSSLIFAILGEMEKLKGEVIVKGSPAYVSQQAWIQNATVRDNILFGKKYNKRRYDLVVKACELERDFQILEAGDQTEIGEKGINLSGGQKQRINLARAVYSDSDLYLFDDPLSAVDAHVGKAIFKNVMSQKGLLAKKTRVLVTHGVHWLPQVNKIVVMSKGTISEQGTYEQLLSHNGAFAQFLEMYLADTKCPDESDNDIELNGVKKAMKSVVDRITSDKSGDEMNYFTDDDRPNKRLNRQRSSTSISQPIHIHESIDLSSTLAGIEKSVHPVGGKLILEEKLETGKVKREVYMDYGRAAGLWAMAGAFLAYAANQGFFVWSSFFLTGWTQDALLLNESTRITQEGKERTDYYILVYSLFFGSTQVIAFYVFNYLFWYRLVRAADRLHHLLLDRLFHAPMSFFDQTPMGRILNRFSKDVDTVDNTLPLILRDFLMTFSIIAITIIVILIETPLFAAVLVPLVILFLLIQNYYVQTSRQLKRMESISRSPIYAYFSETISGAPVIRAYRAMERFKAESERRVDKNQVFYFTSWSAIRWNQLNMDTLANLVVLFSAILQIVAGGEGSDAGLSVSYALQVAGALPYMVRQISEFETNIVSVERMKEYFQVEQEAALINPKNRPSPEWPSKGNVTFVNYQTRYRPGLDLVLKGVNCQIIGGEKIGIVGRTGAGKSSLTLCLFRIIEAVSGSIFVDEVNIADIGLHDLRSKLTILPQ
ncbi:multidrug resistance-associated protein 1, partial [Biomphalaria glabrata]